MSSLTKIVSLSPIDQIKAHLKIQDFRLTSDQSVFVFTAIPSSPDGLLTMYQISHDKAPRHPEDYQLLLSARSYCNTIITSAENLRTEPATTYENWGDKELVIITQKPDRVPYDHKGLASVGTVTIYYTDESCLPPTDTRFHYRFITVDPDKRETVLGNVLDSAKTGPFCIEVGPTLMSDYLKTNRPDAILFSTATLPEKERQLVPGKPLEMTQADIQGAYGTQTHYSPKSTDGYTWKFHALING